MAEPITGRVVKVVDALTLVINRGAEDGITSKHRFLVYGLGDELMDPDTAESLGQLEVVRGIGKVVHV